MKEQTLPVSPGQAEQADPAPKSKWGWLHWVLCLLPVVFIGAFFLFDLSQYAWAPALVALACPLGMVGMMWAMRH